MMYLTIDIKNGLATHPKSTESILLNSINHLFNQFLISHHIITQNNKEH